MAPVLTDLGDCAKYVGKCFVYQLKEEVGRAERVYQGILRKLENDELIFESVVTRSPETFKLEKIGEEIRIRLDRLENPILTEFQPEDFKAQFERAQRVA
jgi:hypothetical protein